MAVPRVPPGAIRSRIEVAETMLVAGLLGSAGQLAVLVVHERQVQEKRAVGDEDQLAIAGILPGVYRFKANPGDDRFTSRSQ